MDNRDLLPHILPHLKVVRGPDGNGDFVCWCPLHADGKGSAPHQPNFKIGPKGFICHACGEKGGLLQLVEKLKIELPGTAARSADSGVLATYSYVDENGVLLYEVVRKAPKQFIHRRPDSNGAWLYRLNGTRRVPYRLPELLAKSSSMVYVVEGEKDADQLHSLGLTATTNSGGAGKWQPEFAEYLRGRDVVILPDNDVAGRKHAELVANSLIGIARSAVTVNLEGLPAKGDVSDWFKLGHGVADLERVVAESKNQSEPTPEETDEPSGKSKRTQADEIIALAQQAGLSLLRDSVGEPQFQISIDAHHEVWPAKGRAVRAWTTQLYFRKHNRAPNLTAINTALNALEAKARLNGTDVVLENRTALVGDSIYYDLADRTWRAMHITSDGWEVEPSPPPVFRRYAHQRPQVLPVDGGSLDLLFELINVPDPGERLLLSVYLVASLLPDIPHPILIVYGPQGSSKTTMSRLIRNLVDPSIAPVQSLPDKPDQLVQALAHNWMPVFDNVSGLARWSSDMLCRAATGEGFTKRALYTDDEDFIWSFRRCPILNGINVAAVQPDLLDRAILIGLERIDPDQRRSESELLTEFESVRALLLGAMFSALSRAIREKPNIIPSSLPRMADFAHWGQAIAVAMKHSPTEFLVAYEENIRRQNTEVINSHPLALAIITFLGERPSWIGGAAELLRQLDELAGPLHLKTDDRSWPSMPNQLTRKLNELSATLLDAGVKVNVSRDRRGSQIELIRLDRDCDDENSIVTPSSRSNSMGDNVP